MSKHILDEKLYSHNWTIKNEIAGSYGKGENKTLYIVTEVLR